MTVVSFFESRSITLDIWNYKKLLETKTRTRLSAAQFRYDMDIGLALLILPVQATSHADELKAS